MSEGIEGVADAITEGVVARAVEPQAGEAAEAHGACLNCGTALAGEYCHRCGQAGHVHRTLGAFWHDVTHSVLHFEGKIWRTLPLLAWRPGDLTRRYIAGERARFVSPMALFLFSVFLMFAVFSTIGGPVGGNIDDDEINVSSNIDPEERAELVAQLAGLQKQRDEAVLAKRGTRPLDISIAAVRQEIAVRNSIENVPIDRDGGKFLDAEDTGIGWFNQAVKRAKENPSLLAYKIQNNAYKFSWALIPISVPFVWLLFLHRRRYRQYRAYDHVVFVTYSIAFMTLLMVALSVGRIFVSEALAGLLLMLVPPLHMYRQLRGAYALGRWSAIWRAAALTVFALIAGSLFFLLLLTIGVAG